MKRSILNIYLLTFLRKFLVEGFDQFPTLRIFQFGFTAGDSGFSKKFECFAAPVRNKYFTLEATARFQTFEGGLKNIRITFTPFGLARFYGPFSQFTVRISELRISEDEFKKRFQNLCGNLATDFELLVRAFTPEEKIQLYREI